MASSGEPPSPSEDIGYKYISLAGPIDGPEEEERLGCLDLLFATAGLGCALLVRTAIIILALVLLYVALKVAGFGSGAPPTGHGPRHVFGESLDWRPFVFAYFLHFQKQFRRRVMNEFHARVHVLE